MQKMLIKHGNSLALVIDKPILDMLQISANTPLEISTNGDQLLVTPCRDRASQKKINVSLENINAKFENDLRRLAQ
jgi:antitoxin MazE